MGHIPHRVRSRSRPARAKGGIVPGYENSSGLIVRPFFGGQIPDSSEAGRTTGAQGSRQPPTTGTWSVVLIVDLSPLSAARPRASTPENDSPSGAVRSHNQLGFDVLTSLLAQHPSQNVVISPLGIGVSPDNALARELLVIQLSQCAGPCIAMMFRPQHLFYENKAFARQFGVSDVARYETGSAANSLWLDQKSISEERFRSE